MQTKELMTTIFGANNIAIYKAFLEENYCDEIISSRKRKRERERIQAEDTEAYKKRIYCLEIQQSAGFAIPTLCENNRKNNLPLFSWFENTVSGSKRDLEILCWYSEIFAVLDHIGVSNPAYAVLSSELFFISRRNLESYIKRHGKKRVAAFINIMCGDVYAPRSSLVPILESEDNLFKALADKGNKIGYTLGYIDNDEDGDCHYTDKLPETEYESPFGLFAWDLPC